MRKILFGLAALFAVLATLGLAPSANATMTGDGTYTAHSESAGTTYTHAGTASYTCNGDGSITVNLQGDESPAGDGHGTGTIVGGVLTVSAVRTGDNYVYSYAGTISPSGAWTMTAYNDEALQTGVTGGGQFVGIPDCVTDPPAPKGNHGEYVSGAVKAGFSGKALAAIAKDVTLVGPYTGPHA